MSKLIYKYLLICMGFCLPGIALMGQYTAQYDQYVFNGLVINPAYAGVKGVLHAQAMTRFQWIGMPGAPRTQNLSLHSTTRNLKNNYGFMLVNDKAGPVRSTMLRGVYAYRLYFQKTTLAFGLQGGAAINSLVQSGLATTQTGDPLATGVNQTVLSPEAGVGVWYTHPRFFAGFSIPQLLRYRSPEFQTLIGTPQPFRHFFLQGGALFPLIPDWQIKPSFLLKYYQGINTQVDLNAMVLYKNMMSFGLAYRTKDSVLGLFEYQVNEQFRLGYSFGTSITPLVAQHLGTHELALSYTFGYLIKTPGLRSF